MSDSVQPHRRQSTRLPHPWDPPGKNTGVGCHFLFQWVKLKSESEVSLSCRLFETLWTAAYQAPPSMGFSRQEYWSGFLLPSPPVCIQCNLWYFYTAKIFTFIKVTFSCSNLYTRFAHLNMIYCLCFLKLLSYIYACVRIMTFWISCPIP